MAAAVIGDTPPDEKRGLTWQVAPEPATQLGAVTFVDVHTGWGVGAQGRIVKTTDGGATWISQSSGTADYLQAVTFLNEREGWAVGALGRILITTDGGATWVYQENRETGNRSLLTAFAHDRWTAWLGGDEGVIVRTIDGGVTWQAADTNTRETIRSIWFVDAWEGWAVGHLGTMLHTSDGGATWTDRSSQIPRLHFTATTFGDAQTGYASGWLFLGYSGGASSTHHLVKTVDGGLTWSELAANPFPGVTSLFFHDAQTGWAAGSPNGFGRLSRTLDGGESWQTVPLPEEFALNLQVAFANRQIGWLITSGQVLRTQDGGTTWSPVATEYVTQADEPWSPRPFTPTDLAIVDERTVWLTGSVMSESPEDEGPLLVTRNGGDTWSQVQPPPEVMTTSLWTASFLNSITFVDQDQGWAANSSDLIIFTTDGGATWQRATVHQPPSRTLFSSVSQIAFYDSQSGWAIGSTGEVLLATTDGGRNWSYQVTPDWTYGTTTDPYNFHTLTVTRGGVPFILGNSGLVLSYGTPDAAPATPSPASTSTPTGTLPATVSPAASPTSTVTAVPERTPSVTAVVPTDYSAYLPLLVRSSAAGW